MRKTYVLLFLALFVAAGSMMFIGGVQQVHAMCSDGDTTVGKVSTVTVSVSKSTAIATVAGASPSVCEGGAYQASGWVTAKLLNSGGAVVANGSCDNVDTYPDFSISCSVSLSGVPAGQYTIKANTHTYYNGLQVDGTPKSSSSFTVVASESISLAASPTSINSGSSAKLTATPSNVNQAAIYKSDGTLVCNGTSCSDSPTVTTSYYAKGIGASSGNSVISNSVTVTVTAACTDSTWSPDPSTKCSGVSFTQTSNCGNTRTVNGTATCYACSGTSCNAVSSGTSGYLSSNCNNACAPTPTFTIAPSSATIQVGGTQQYTGYYDPDGPSGTQASQTVSASSVVWSSSNTSAATIASSGLATGVAAGSTTIRGTYNGITATANLNVQGTTADFSISISPTSQSVVQGSSVAYTVTISSLNGFTGTINLSESDLTTGLSGTFSPTSVSGGSGTSQFTLSASASAASGTSDFMITGTSGALSHSVRPTVNVTAGSPPPPTVSDTVPVDVYFCTSPSDPTPGCASAPGCVISASPQNIMTGASSQLTWSCTGIPTTTRCLVSGNQGVGNIWVSSGWDGSNVSQRVRPRNTTRYTLSCDGGTNVSADVEVHVGFLPVLREIIPQW